MTPSPFNPETDTLGANRATGSATSTPPSKLYSTNPYWKRSGNSAQEEQSVPESAPSINVAETPVVEELLLPSHLIAALTSAIDKASQAQGEQLTRQLSDWLPTMSQKLTPVVEQYLEKSLPKVVKVEQPGQTTLLLVRYLTIGMVVSGLVMGGLLFAWLQARQQRDTFANGFWLHRYVKAKATVDRSTAVTQLLRNADTLHQSSAFSAELTRLESIIEARQQQYQLQLRERELIRNKNR
ncbi:hypothetical protein [Fibrella aestuarina]|nr:hypothetical protein [Fibrella aestuarina]